VDIENGKDLAELPASTLPGSGSIGFVPIASTGDGETWEPASDVTVANTEQAAMWRRLADAAWSLPPNYKRRRFLIDWATSDGNRDGAARRHGLTKDVARDAVSLFLRRTGVAETLVFRGARSQARAALPDPPPVRRLSKKEIASLPYRAPKEIS
jgi:hypothetical protein